MSVPKPSEIRVRPLKQATTPAERFEATHPLFAETAAHVRGLHERRMSVKEIASTAGVKVVVVKCLVFGGRADLTPGDAARLKAVAA